MFSQHLNYICMCAKDIKCTASLYWEVYDALKDNQNFSLFSLHWVSIYWLSYARHHAVVIVMSKTLFILCSWEYQVLRMVKVLSFGYGYLFACLRFCLFCFGSWILSMATTILSMQALYDGDTPQPHIFLNPDVLQTVQGRYQSNSPNILHCTKAAIHIPVIGPIVGRHPEDGSAPSR